MKKVYLLDLCLIVFLPFWVGYYDKPANMVAQEIILDDSKLQLVSIENIDGSRDVAGLLEANITPTFVDGVDDIDPHRATLSPDGETIVFYRHDRERGVSMVCEYRFSSNSSTCVEGDKELLEFNGGWWSSDSRYVVLDMDINILQLGQEADLTIYDTQTDTIINRTDDGVSASERVFEDDVRNRVWMDTAPIFAPNGDLYFFRNAIDTSVGEWRADLMRIAANEITNTTKPEVLWRHPAEGAFIVYRARDWYLDGTMSISPDGKYLAIASFDTSTTDNTNNTIWLFDLAQQSMKTQIPVSRLGEAIMGIPTWLTEQITTTQLIGIIFSGLAWTDDNHLMIKASNFVYDTQFFIPIFKYDVNTDTLESVYDFSFVSEDGYKPDITLFDEVSISADISISMNVMSPSGQTMFYIGRDAITDTFVLSAISVVESGFTTPRRIATLTDYEPRSRIVTSVGYTAPTLRILTGTTLITLTEQ